MEESRIEYLLKKIEEQTSNAGEEQEKILENILKRNAETDYLNKFLHGQTDQQLFKKYVPVVTYQDIKSYIDRIVDGEPPNIFTTETITEFIPRFISIQKVTAFHNKSPKFQFVERQNVVLSIDMDKTSEADLSKAIKAAEIELEPHGFLLTAYSSFADTGSIPGRYVLFWELKLRDSNTDQLKLDSNTMEQCCRRVEESLDFTYRLYRKMNLIGPLEIRVVKFGAFDELMNFFVSRVLHLSNTRHLVALKLRKPLKYWIPGLLGSSSAMEILHELGILLVFLYLFSR